MPRKDSILKKKTEAYAARIIRLYKYLTTEKREVTMSRQIYRSGTSIGANVAESINAQTPADFITKLSIALKEANETEYWLRSLLSGGYIDQKGFDSMFNDNEEIVKMLVSSIKTIRKRVEPNER